MNTVIKHPAFPLGIVVFPGHVQGLHVYELRYRKLFKELMNGEFNRFIIPFARASRWDVYGSEVKLKEIVLERSNGELDVIVEGVSVVKITQAYLASDKADYHQVSIVRKKFNDLSADRFFLEELKKVLQPILKPDERDLAGFNGNIFDLATWMQLNEPEKMKFISLKNNTERKRFLLNMGRIRVSLAAQMKGRDDGIMLN